MTKKANTPATILIVDDNPVNLEMLFQYFAHSAFKTLVAQDGESALLQLEQTRSDLILLDILMPGIDGFETCCRLKANESTQNIPVIFMTALSATADKVKGFEVGGVDYITKPFQYEEVMARVNAHLTIRRQQQQLQEQTVLLEEKNAQLKALNANKDKFFSIIAHDLKSPFAGLVVAANLIKEHIERWNTDKIKRSADQLQKSVDNLYAFIENLLTWSRFQQEAMEYTPQFVDFQFIIARNVALVIQNAQQKQITLRNSIQEQIPAFIDVNMVDAVVRNLLSNAIKFTKAGGTVEISATHDKNTLKVAISDTGIGIPDENLPDLFRIDTKTQQVGTAGEQGTGLGLILCKEFVEQHAGTIWVESEVGRGSTFWFTLPKKPME
jgi:two-component system sensor histidine kinase/response regulator